MGVLDLGAAYGQDRGVLTRVVVALTVVASVALSGCQGDEPPEPAPTSIEAFPDLPHLAGPLEVELHAALPLMTGDEECLADPEAGRLCSADGATGYRVLGSAVPVMVDEVSTAPTSDHTSWGTTVRFAAESRADVRRAREQAAGLGGSSS